MIPIAATSLPPDIARQLYALQSEIDGIADYADRVRAAETLYKSKRRTVPFRSVVAELKSLCAGVERCMYCEDSRSADIEHFRPKCFYPELTFVWTNYLNACTNCNRPKSNRFAVYAHATGQKTDLIRGGNNPVPPEPGDPVLINPRIENPLDFLFLDLRDTFEFLPSAPPGTPEYERAEYTIEILGLNDITPSVRREYYGSLLCSFRTICPLAKSRQIRWRFIETCARVAKYGASNRLVRNETPTPALP